MTAGATVTWVYAVTRGLDPAVLDGVSGVSGAPVREVREGALGAAVSPVDAAAFSEELLQRRLGEPRELEEMARAHHRVIGAVSAAAPALPLRLGAVCTGDGGVRAMLAERRPEFTRTLDWLAARAEYGVKVWASPDALIMPRPGTGAASRPGAGHPGAGQPRPGPGGPGPGCCPATEGRLAGHPPVSGLNVA